MSKESENGAVYRDLSPPIKERFPRIVIIIVLAEFCERFSYSGMRAFLTIYLRSKLDFSDDGATEIYHIFSTFVYFFPIVGGILADNYLGKFRTILYMMFVYAAGNLLVAVSAIPHLGIPARLCTMIGLLMITLGTGGIKPCVTAFGGDQFKLPEQENNLALYFSILYFITCTGSLIAKTVSPILRSEVHCFGDKDCYSIAFGAPGLVVLCAIIIFVCAKNHYVMKKPEGNIVLDFLKCISLGLKNRLIKGKVTGKDAHWLDCTKYHYDQRFIKDVKKTLNILMLFTVLPVFWSLLDQMGSRWTLQATKMDGRFGPVTVKPDQMQVLCPIFILILIPTAQKVIYPFLEKRNILKNPLHKLTLGGVLAGVAFIFSGAVEIYLKTTYPQLPSPGYSQLRIFNSNPCSVSIHNDPLNLTYTIPSFSYIVKKDLRVKETQNFSVYLGGSCIEPREEYFRLEENKAVSFYFMQNEVYRFKDNVEKSKSGLPFVRFLIAKSLQSKNITFYNERRNEIETSAVTGVSKQIEVFASTYSLWVDEEIVMNNLQLSSGGVYTVLIDTSSTMDRYVTKLIVITEANSITMALLLPQFFIISVAEVLFAVTGNEFAYKESPESMRAVMTAAWLLTDAVGNVIIIVITRLLGDVSQERQFFVYTGLMFLSISIFYYMAKGYQFGHDTDDVPRKELRSNSEVLYLQVKQAEDCLDH